MVRASMSIQIPKEYKDNESKGLCRVCGKPKEEFEKGRRVHCSQECADKYQECFVYWETFRNEILKKYPYCKICNSKENLEVDHIIPVAITDFVFDEENVQVLCRTCHLIKTKKDLMEIKKHKNNQTSLLN